MCVHVCVCVSVRCRQSAELRAHHTAAVHVSSFRSVDSIGRRSAADNKKHVRSFGPPPARALTCENIFTHIQIIHRHTHVRSRSSDRGSAVCVDSGNSGDDAVPFRVCVYIICNDIGLFFVAACVYCTEFALECNFAGCGRARVLFVVKEPYNFSSTAGGTVIRACISFSSPTQRT